jgi:murein DD-endopeptidase MepM/ murein hydrolase activator NlpD
MVKRGDIIANTGSSGLALGDHLHFSLMIQGEMVRPEEWMDRNWINVNITKIIAEAKKIIQANGQ